MSAQPAKLSIHPVGLMEVLSYSRGHTLALTVLSPAARYAAEQSENGFWVPGLRIYQEDRPDVSIELTRVVDAQRRDATLAALWWLKREMSLLPTFFAVMHGSELRIPCVNSLGLPLEGLCFVGSGVIRQNDALSGFPTLRVLKLMRFPVSEMNWLPALSSLTALALKDCGGIKDFGGLAAAPQLRKLALPATDVSNLDWVLGGGAAPARGTRPQWHEGADRCVRPKPCPFRSATVYAGGRSDLSRLGVRYALSGGAGCR